VWLAGSGVWDCDPLYIWNPRENV